MTDTTWLYDLEAEVDEVLSCVGEVLDNAWIESVDDQIRLGENEGLELRQIIADALSAAYAAGAAMRMVQ